MDKLLSSAVRSEMVYSDPVYIKEIWDYTTSEIAPVLDTTEKRYYTELLGVQSEPMFIQSPPETQQDAQAYLWEKDNTVYLTFRGTSSKKDALADMNVIPQKIKDDIYVHKGFYNQFKSIEPVITAELQSDKYKDRITTIHVSGHSLAAALSQIAAAYYGDMFPELYIICHSFGCPRVGNKKFVEWFDTRVKEHMRVANNHDPITMIPQRSYWHHTPRCLIFYSDTKFKMNEKDKRWYIVRFVSSLFRINCLHPIKDHTCELYIQRLENQSNPRISSSII